MPPKDFGDEKAVLAEIDDTYARYRRRRLAFERNWYRNILFMMGNQWIKWDRDAQRWRERKLQNWVPKPVTNLFGSTGERLAAMLSQVEPNWAFIPGGDSENDFAAAEVAAKLEPILAEENGIDLIRELVAKWVAYTGNAFLMPGAEEINKPQAQPPQQLAGMIASLMGAGEEPTPPSPSEYKLYTDVLSPFEVHADLSIPLMSDQQRILIVNRRDKDYVKNLYGITVDDTSLEDVGLNYLEYIGYISADSGVTDYAYASDQRIPRVMVKRVMIRPSEDWPEGLYGVSAGSKLCESKGLPKDSSGQSDIPIIHIKFDSIPGAFFGRTPMDDMVSKQLQLNKLDSMIELITLRVCSPVWLMPEGTVVRGFTGEPGAILKYSMIGEKANRPDRIPGEQIPGTLLTWRDAIKQEFEDIGSTYDAIKGKAPYSGVPGVVVDQLIEQGMTRFGPVFRNIAEGYRQWMKMQLELFKQYATTPRVQSIMGENAKWKMEQFTKADLTGSVNIRVESESTVPRSDQVESAKTLAAVQSGIIQLDDPLVKLKVLKKLRLSDLVKTTNEDVLDAVREHDVLLGMDPAQVEMLAQQIAQAQKMGQPPPPLPISVKPFLQNHEVHIAKHRSFALSDEGKPYEMAMITHITQHHMIMDAQNTQAGMPPGGNGKQPSATQAQQQAITPGAQKEVTAGAVP